MSLSSLGGKFKAQNSANLTSDQYFVDLQDVEPFLGLPDGVGYYL